MHTLKKEIQALLTGVEPTLLYDLLIINICSLNAPPLSYRRLVGAKAIELVLCDKHPAYC